MPIDVRRTIVCSAGELISATIMDDYMSLSGLITTRGECQIAGSGGSIGDTITFTGVNRSLKIISVSPSPLENITYIRFGCPVTLALQAQYVDFTTRVEIEYQDPVPEWWASIDYIPALSLNELLTQCAAGMRLGNATSLGSLGTTPVYLFDGKDSKYEFTSTYASTITSILAGAAQYGFYNNGAIASAGVLSPTAAGTTLISEDHIIATGPASSNGVPAGAYGLSYSTFGVKIWQRVRPYPETVCNTVTTTAETRYVYYSFDEDVEDPDNDPTEDAIEYSYAPKTKTCSYTNDKLQEYLVVESVEATGSLDNYAANLATAGFDTTATFAARRECTQVTTTAREFDVASHVVKEVVEVKQELAVLGSALSLPFARPAEKQSTGDIRPAEIIVTLPGSTATFTAEFIERTTKVVGKDLVLTTRRWIAAGYTPEGQQAAAESAKNTRSAATLTSILYQSGKVVALPIEVQVLSGAAKQWNQDIVTAENQAKLDEQAGVSDGIATVYGVTSFTGYVNLLGDPAFAPVNLTLPFAFSTKTQVAQTVEQPDGSFKVEMYKNEAAKELNNIASAYIKAYDRLETAKRQSFNVQVGLDKAPSTVCRMYQVSVNGAVISGVSTGATFQLTADGGICSFDVLPLGTIGSLTGGSFIPAIGPVPPLPPTIIDPDTGDEVYDLDDVILTPVKQPLSKLTEGGINLGVLVYSFSDVPEKTSTTEAGIALGLEATSRYKVTIQQAFLGLALGVSANEPSDPVFATYTQSSAYDGTTPASFENMTDGSFTNTGAGTDDDSPAFVQADLGSTRYIVEVHVGTATDNMPGGWDYSYTENADIQVSDDEISWTTVGNTGTLGGEGIFSFPVGASARYLRLTTTGYLGVTEMRIAAY